MAAAVGLLLGSVHLLVWIRLRSGPEFLLAAAMAFSAGIVAVCEATYLGSPTSEDIQFGLEFQNIAIAGMLVSMIWFVHFRLGSGRIWLAWAITLAWVVCLIASIASPGNLTFATVEKVDYLSTPWGETYGVATGEFHPLKILSDLASLAIMVFVTDAAITAFRAGRRQLAARTGGSILFFIVVAGIHTPLVDAGILSTPYIISLVFVAICIALTLDLADDVVQSVQANASLRRERQRWSALTENVDLAVVRADEDEHIAYANPFLERISGKSHQELLGAPVSALFVDDLPEAGQTNSPPDTWTSQARVLRRVRSSTGASRDLVWYSVALVAEDGTSDGFISFGQDVTDQIRAENESRRTRQEIERLTRALALGELSSSLAHELSQPIAAILSNTQTLQILRSREGHPETEIDAILRDIFNDSRRAKGLMQRVRGFMYNRAPDAEEFDLSAAVSEVVEMVRIEAQRNHVSIELTDATAFFPVKASRIEIQQVLLNLLLNAIQATGTKVGAGKVSVTWDKAESKTVILEVEDNGPGLTSDQQAAVFEPFVTTKSTGMGIGLAVSKRIVERHGGKISADSSQLGGAKFSIELPIYVEETVARRA